MNKTKIIYKNTNKEKRFENLLLKYTQDCIITDGKFTEYAIEIRNQKIKTEKENLSKKLLNDIANFKLELEKENISLSKEIDKAKFPMKYDNNLLSLSNLTEFNNAIQLFSNADTLNFELILNSLKSEKRNDCFFRLCQLIENSNFDNFKKIEIADIYKKYCDELNISEKINEVESNNFLIGKLDIYLNNVENYEIDLKKLDVLVTNFEYAHYK